jgi:ABC-type multidrug transport system fused ATPase/permease subunit
MIIPQVPQLLSDALRQNLDPFDQHHDATLNDALRAAGLFSVKSEEDEGRIKTAVSSGGGNLSIGQRQILALAWATLRHSKLLILYEGEFG